MDYYELLGVPRTATEAEIKKAYRRCAMQYHPDRNPGDKEAESKFKEIQEAYAILGDLQKKMEYDHKGYVGPGGFNYENRQSKQSQAERDEAFVHSAGRRYKANQAELDSIKQSFFGGGGQSGSNILIHLLMTPYELRNGAVKGIRWKKRDKCKKCDGYGAAVFTESEFVKCKACKGSGNVANVFGKLGAQYPKCDFCDGSGFLDMYCKWCKGSGITVDMVIEEMMVEVPAGTPSGHQIVIRGRGEPGSKGGMTGNLHICVIEHESTPELTKK